MTRPDERRFVLFQRGHVRDQIILAHMRNQMRTLVNPDTKALFTEDEILRITQDGSRYYIEADAIDLYGQAVQAKNSYFVDQIIPSRSSTAMLQKTHGPLWLPDGYLPASGGSGEASAAAAVGTIYVGSTTVPDPAATWGRDPNGKRYQVLVTTVTPGSGTATLTLVGIDGGEDTNLAVGTEITWSNPPIGAAPTATVTIAFEGGLGQETDAEFASRIEDRIRHKPASGNRAHFRAWARQASNLVETAFVHACVLHAGSVAVVITKKRGASVGPLGRIPTLALVAIVSGYLVPPSSSVVPGPVHVLVLKPAPASTNLAISIGLRRGAAGGWSSARPWPRSSASYPKAMITSVTSQTVFRIGTDVAPVGTLPLTGASAPQMMVWNEDISEFERLNVASVAFIGTNLYEITLSQSPTFTIVPGDVISPYTDRLVVIASALEAYFDLLGPGELIDLATDVRATRAFRWPPANEEYPQRAGQGMVTTILDTLGGAAGDAQLVHVIQSVPAVPASVSDGPNMLVLGKVGIYDLE
jgi:hypothetical protein